MKKKNTIHLLPELPNGKANEFYDKFMENWELAATIDFIPDSLETLRAIDYTELRMLMNQNDKFFNAAVELCSDLIEDLINCEKIIAAELYEEGEIKKKHYKAIMKVKTLDDLLTCGHYCDDYERARGAFITILLEDHLYKKLPKRNKSTK